MGISTAKNRKIAQALVDGPRYDLAGPTVHDDIRRAINRYGVAAVRAAVKELAKPKRGRPKINDWKELAPVFKAEAEEWLSGGDPIAARSNYSIAKAFAEANPGQSPISTHQRVERKLAKKPYGRRWFMLVTAMEKSEHHYPYGLYIRALEELAALDDGHPTWKAALKWARSDVADYTAKVGNPPPSEATIAEVRSGARNALLALTTPLKLSDATPLLPPRGRI